MHYERKLCTQQKVKLLSNYLHYIYIGTYINEKTKIITPDDIEKVANEFAQFPYERLLQVHLVGADESGIYVNGMLGIEMYIDLYAQHNYA